MDGTPKRVVCGNCLCWIPIPSPDIEPEGICIRKAPGAKVEQPVSVMVLGVSEILHPPATWPRTANDEGCFEGIPKRVVKRRRTKRKRKRSRK